MNLFPEHVDAIVTSSYFASEDKFIDLARNSLKFEIEDEQECFINPYKNKWRKRKEVLVEDQDDGLKQEFE